MPVIGTAGHVDHGKSTLVRALTGREPDRWEEEKRRGLTIDLGFAWTTLPSGARVGFVDVPGHERFIKNMLAGVDAIDVVLLAVAADEGWMPQSEEHLAVLDLLGISRGVVALTRCDLVDAATLDRVSRDVTERLQGTSLADAVVIPTAAPAGTGLSEIEEALDRALVGTVQVDRGRPRLWVDRSFTIGGAGTVVTGTLVDGAISVDDVLSLHPGATTARVRSIQSHEETVATIGPGSRAAINLAGLDRAQVHRGSMLGVPGQWDPTARFTALARPVRSLGAPIGSRGAYHLHLGSGSWPARIRILDAETLDAPGVVLVETDEPIPVRWGDRLILREVGRQAVVAGGRVLDPSPPRRVRDAIEVATELRRAAGPDDAATALLSSRGSADRAVLAAHTGGGSPSDPLAAGSRVYARRRAAEVVRTAVGVVEEFHTANPYRPGIPKASLSERLGVPAADLDALLGTSDELVIDGPSVRSSGFAGALQGAAAAAWETVRDRLAAAGWAPPRRGDLDVDPEIMHALVRSGRVVAVSPDLIYLAETLDEIEERTRTLADGFTVADFRDALGITRKHAVPLLEWFDGRGVTRRVGEGRIVRPPQPDGR